MKGSRCLWPAWLTVMIAGLLLAGSAGAAMRFGDPAGDANGGPDIRRVTIGDKGGVVTFKFTVTNLDIAPENGVNDAGVVTFLRTTGGSTPEYYFYFGRDTEGSYWDIINGKTDKAVAETQTTRYAASGNTYTLQMSSSDLGGATGFSFYSKAATWDAKEQRTEADRAPDGGAWSYNLTNVKPVIGAATTSLVTPTAGKALKITIPVTRSDTGAKIEGGATMTLDPMIGTMIIGHSEQLRNGTAIVQVNIPPTAKGKHLTVRIAIKLGTQTATRTISIPIA